MKNPEWCGRPGVSTSVVCDPTRKLNKENKDVMEGLLNTIKRVEMAVLLIEKMSTDFVSKFGYDDSSVDIAAAKFARKVHDDWGVGDKNLNNGILLFISIKDRIVYFSTGSGVGISVDHFDVIIESMKNELRNQDYSSAIERAIIHVDVLLGNEISGELADKYRPSIWSSLFDFFAEYLMIICVIAIVVVSCLCSTESEESRLRRGQQAMTRLVRDVENASDNQYHATSCPICLEDFPAIPGANEDSAKSKTEKEEIKEKETVETSSSESKNDIPVVNSEAVLQSARNNPRRPMKIQCGHVFCHQCLQEFLKQTDTKCPICRRPLNGSPGDIPHPPPNAPPSNDHSFLDSSNHFDNSSCSSSSYNQSVRTQNLLNNMYRDEMMFRMMRMHVLYPRVMDDTTMQRMRTAEQPSDFRMAAENRNEQVNQLIRQIEHDRAEAAKRGSSGSSRSSFGGGSSSGGRGGRW